jgi:hypothetical protein
MMQTISKLYESYPTELDAIMFAENNIQLKRLIQYQPPSSYTTSQWGDWHNDNPEQFNRIKSKATLVLEVISMNPKHETQQRQTEEKNPAEEQKPEEEKKQVSQPVRKKKARRGGPRKHRKQGAVKN